MTVKAPHARAAWHDAYDAQMGLWRWYRTRTGERFLATSYRENSTEHTRELLADLYAAESTRLLDLDPIHVSRDMCEVITAAYPGFAPEPLLETDLITPRGFLYFATPFEVMDRFDKPTTIAAASWARIFATASEFDRDHVREWMHTQEGFTAVEFEEKLAQFEGINVSGVAITLYTSTRREYELWHEEDDIVEEMTARAPLLPLHVTPWYFGMTYDGNEVDVDGHETGAGWWWRILQTSFRLMQQRVSVRHRERPHRSLRREAKRAGLPHEPEIVVVRLRREQGERHEPSGEEGNYSHRWIVGGHWRNQWYPSDHIHRQIWISPYVKGPEDRPLIVRPRRVYQWER